MASKENLVEYNDDSIEEFEGCSAVRMRPTMYIQELGRRGIFRCVQEISGNSLDEFNVGRATTINVFLNVKTSEIIIVDDGSGIPIGSIIKCATKLHSGGKFNSNVYESSIGLNGVGLTCTNATAIQMIIDVWREGKHANVQFSQGVITQNLKVVETGDFTKQGTSVTFTPDIEIFGDIEIEPEIYIEYFTILSYINKGVKINLQIINKDGSKSNHKFASKNGIIDFMNEKVLKKQKPISQSIEIPFYEETFEGSPKPRKMSAEVCFTWVSNTRDTTVLSYVNGIPTEQGGYHVNGLLDGVIDVLRPDLKSMLTRKDPEYAKFNRDDFLEGFTCILLSKHSKPLFDGQTKNYFSSLDYEPFINNYVKKKFQEWSRLNPSRYRFILNQVILSARSRLAAIKARSAIQKQVPINLTALLSIPRYEPCRFKDPTLTELFIVEGDSAGGSAKTGRNADTQAIYKMMGKPTNVYNKALDAVAKKTGINTIGDLMTIIGKVGTKFSKYIVMADADPDGAHITSLLLGFFFRFREDLIRDGYVFLANPPLYGISMRTKGKKKSIYIDTDEEYKRIIDVSIMKEFKLVTFNDKKVSEITNVEFYKQFLFYLRDYSLNIDTLSKQVNVNPMLLEAIILYYNRIISSKKIRINDWELDVYYSEEFQCNIIEGIYDNIFHKIELTPFFKEQCMTMETQINNIKWSNLMLIHKDTNTRLGPGLYKMSSGIDNIINGNTTITRFKGLGEMDPSQLWETTMNPETRLLTQVTMDDKFKDRYLSELNMLLGDDINARKEYYKEYL